jgi:acetyltransferase
MTIRNLDRLLNPRSVAFFGASPEAGSVGNIVARNLLNGGFKGSIQFVNPHHALIEGHKAVASTADLAEVPDLAIIATPPPTVPGIVSEIGKRGTRAAVVITAGIDALQRQDMLSASQPYCLRIQGPNCLGLMLPNCGLNASFCHVAPLTGDLALLSQSGALITSIVDWARSRSIGFSHIVSLGDMADADFGDLLDYLAADISSRAILIYMEALTHAPKFMSAARRAARAKPVIVIKSGRHAAGARAALSHTGALAGSDAAYDAAFRRAGLLRVREMEELFDAAEILSRSPKLKGESLMILTNGGGAGVLAADRLADWNGELASLSVATQAALDNVLPKTWSRSNPVDIIGDAKPERYRDALKVLLADPSAENHLVMNCPTALADSTDAARATIEAVEAAQAKHGKKFVIAAWLGDGTAEPGRALFREHGIPAFETADDAISGFMQRVRYTRAQNELMRTPPAAPEGYAPDTAGASAIIAGALTSRRTLLNEVEAKGILAHYGINTVPTRVAETPEIVSRVAFEVLTKHESVALKILSPDISHKSDVGGVQLDIETAAEARAAAEAMIEKVKRIAPGAHIAGFTVQPMIKKPRAHELIAGMSVDPTFGPLITFGTGGTAVEAIRDTAQALPPLDLGLAMDLIKQTRISRLLSGYRNRPAADMQAIALTLVRLCALIASHPEIRELDINPLLADDTGVVALDARIVVAETGAEARTPMAIRPYPSEWEAEFMMQEGRKVLIRPIRPDDESAYELFFKNVSPEDARMRFFTPVKELSHAFVARLTQIDYAREIAFVAIDRENRHLLGVVRFAADPDYKRGEFAVLVQTPLKGLGLGWRLMQHLIAYAKAEGLEELFGLVLSENTTMLDMCQTLGFSVTTAEGDASLREVRLRLRGA